MNRGDVFVVADRGGGDYAGKPRPALVVQSDAFRDTDSVVICPVTTVERPAALLRVPILPSPTLAILAPSWLMVERLTSVRRSRATQHLGRLSREELLAFDRALALFLGFA